MNRIGEGLVFPSQKLKGKSLLAYAFFHPFLAPLCSCSLLLPSYAPGQAIVSYGVLISSLLLLFVDVAATCLTVVR